jgi:hypothetical protein
MSVRLPMRAESGELVCARCGEKIPEKRQVAEWISKDGGLFVRFLCERCGNLPEYKDITEKVTGKRS